MGELIINNHIIDAPVTEILAKLQLSLVNGKLEYFHDKASQIQVQCPVHNDGHEKHGSCYINVSSDNAPYLWVHCFTCGFSAPFEEFVARCLDCSTYEAKQWLIDNFSSVYISPTLHLDSIKLGVDQVESNINLDLSEFESYHPYMTKRHISDEIIEKYELKYDPLSKSIVFPVRDKQGNLVALTKRSTEGKKFYIDKDFNKKNIYLLYDMKDKREVYVTESQINALTLRSWGYNAIALFGAACTDEQIKELNATNIKHFILALDNDEAGVKGTKKLCKYLSKSKFVDIIKFTDTRDVNDLTKEEFDKLERIDKSSYKF